MILLYFVFGLIKFAGIAAGLAVYAVTFIVVVFLSMIIDVGGGTGLGDEASLASRYMVFWSKLGGRWVELGKSKKKDIGRFQDTRGGW